MAKIKKAYKIILVLLVVLGVYFGFKHFGIDQYISLEALKENRNSILDWVDSNYVLAVVGYIVGYILFVALSLPGATVLTIGGGMMFGVVLSTIYINIGATTGASIIFLMVRYFIGKSIQAKYAESLDKFNKEVEENGWGYFLTLRFIPAFPFFLINMFSGLTKVRFKTFVWTTSVGILPGTIIYTFAGSNLKNINNIRDIASKEVIIAFVLLGLFALVPTLIKKFKGKKISNVEI